MAIDAHVHFWRPARGDDILILRREPRLRRDYLPGDLRGLMRDGGVDSAVVVQSAPSLDETRFLLELTRALDWIAGVVGWVDLAAPDVAQTLGDLARAPKLCGVRAMLHRIDDPAWIARDDVAAGLRALAARGLALDLIARPPHLEACRRALTRVPELRAVVDHGGGPPIAAAGWEPWASRIAALARDTTAFCKFSGLLEEAAAGAAADALARHAAHLVDCFGSERLVWASNWPVVDLVGGYANWRAVADALATRLGLDRARVFAGNARVLYDLDRRRT
jgi:L-fuconolactonase